MKTFEDQVSEYLAALGGTAREDAYHRLIELGPGVIPPLRRRFLNERDPAIRTMLVNIAWQSDVSGALVLLKEALDDREPDVWKEALDGLSTVGGPVALEVMRECRTRAIGDKADWLDEAIEHVTDAS
jgi:hypothetical protein